MLQVEVFDASRATEAAATFHRDGFVVCPMPSLRTNWLSLSPEPTV